MYMTSVHSSPASPATPVQDTPSTSEPGTRRLLQIFYFSPDESPIKAYNYYGSRLNFAKKEHYHDFITWLLDGTELMRIKTHDLAQVAANPDLQEDLVRQLADELDRLTVTDATYGTGSPWLGLDRSAEKHVELWLSLYQFCHSKIAARILLGKVYMMLQRNAPSLMHEIRDFEWVLSESAAQAQVVSRLTIDSALCHPFDFIPAGKSNIQLETFIGGAPDTDTKYKDWLAQGNCLIGFVRAKLDEALAAKNEYDIVLSADQLDRLSLMDSRMLNSCDEPDPELRNLCHTRCANRMYLVKMYLARTPVILPVAYVANRWPDLLTDLLTDIHSINDYSILGSVGESTDEEAFLDALDDTLRSHDSEFLPYESVAAFSPWNQRDSRSAVDTRGVRHDHGSGAYILEHGMLETPPSLEGPASQKRH
ncbi:hypothetical protein SeLEV6574_g02747 [Synchytrium endobioticum]|nr:hypothetical protein SeLEV6574_g02747 [Synchytrium endobioticum]